MPTRFETFVQGLGSEATLSLADGTTPTAEQSLQRLFEGRQGALWKQIDTADDRIHERLAELDRGDPSGDADAERSRLHSELRNLEHLATVLLDWIDRSDVGLATEQRSDGPGARLLLPVLWRTRLGAAPPSDPGADLPQEKVLRQEWYESLGWEWQTGPSPRTPPRRAMPQSWFEELEYYLYPGGMPRTVYGAYLLYVAAYEEVARAIGALPPFVSSASAAEAAMEAATWPPTERERRGCTDEEWLEDRVLNGVYPVPWRKVPGTDEVRGVFDFSDLALREAGCLGAGWPWSAPPLLLPNLMADFRVVGDGLQIVRIHVQYRRSPFGRVSDPERDLEPFIVVERSARFWERAMTLLRGVLVLQAQIEVHLARCHHHGELLQVAVHRTLSPDHPVYQVLAPHVASSDVLNKAGDSLITGSWLGVLPQVTPITNPSLLERIGRDMGSVDWRTFRPRAPLCRSDTYAEAANVYWDMVVDYVSAALADYRFDDDDEVRDLSEELRTHGVRYHPFQGVDAGPDSPWVDVGELPAPRDRGEPACSPLESRADVLQFVAHAIFHLTFVHTWVNNSQWDDGGDAVGAPMGVHARVDASDATWRDHGRAGAVPQAMQRLLAIVLTKIDIGYIYFDDLRPLVDRGLRLRVAALAAPFQPYTEGAAAQDVRLSVDHIRSRVSA